MFLSFLILVKYLKGTTTRGQVGFDRIWLRKSELFYFSTYLLKKLYNLNWLFNQQKFWKEGKFSL